jgi:hypothetical protein
MVHGRKEASNHTASSIDAVVHHRLTTETFTAVGCPAGLAYNHTAMPVQERLPITCITTCECYCSDTAAAILCGMPHLSVESQTRRSSVQTGITRAAWGRNPLHSVDVQHRSSVELRVVREPRCELPQVTTEAERFNQVVVSPQLKIAAASIDRRPQEREAVAAVGRTNGGAKAGAPAVVSVKVRGCSPEGGVALVRIGNAIPAPILFAWVQDEERAVAILRGQAMGGAVIGISKSVLLVV